MSGGAWPFLVGEVICLLNCVNERDHSLLNSGQGRGVMGEAVGTGVQRGNPEGVRLLWILSLPWVFYFLEGLFYD
jgi:hypothetical protein